MEGRVPPAVQNKDTTKFEAKAVKANRDATAEDLLATLPGITVILARLAWGQGMVPSAILQARGATVCIELPEIGLLAFRTEPVNLGVSIGCKHQFLAEFSSRSGWIVYGTREDLSENSSVRVLLNDNCSGHAHRSVIQTMVGVCSRDVKGDPLA